MGFVSDCTHPTKYIPILAKARIHTFTDTSTIDFINRDELVEITPEHIRLRKKIFQETMRLREISATRRSEEEQE